MSKNAIGRPSLNDKPMTAKMVTLTTENVATARLLGSGNVSKGVRIALDEASKRVEK